jgi:hypothetical protein
MSLKHIKRRDFAGRRAVVTLMLLSCLTLFGIISPAMATKPTGDFANFADCPLSNPLVKQCLFSQVSSGEVKIGSTAVPIKNTITLQGGKYTEEEVDHFVGAADGNTLSKTPQTVPGGLLGVVAPEALPTFVKEILNEFINKGITGVTATTELVGSVGLSESNLVNGVGVAITLPVRIHLNNAFLGAGCYLGSSSHPVTLELTTGVTEPPAPNEPISGTLGEIEFKDNFNLLVITGNKLVDNTFSVPKASGCGGLLSLLVDPAVDLKLGLPSESGHNTAILEGRIEKGAAKAVRESEK